MRKAFSLPRSCIQIPRAGKKRLKEQKSTITKTATYAQKRELRFSFCSLVCAECGYPFHGLSQSDAESVFFAPKLYEYTASGQKTLKGAKINYNKSRSLRPKARAAVFFLLFGLRRM
jgi:hypothetical protein